MENAKESMYLLKDAFYVYKEREDNGKRAPVIMYPILRHQKNAISNERRLVRSYLGHAGKKADVIEEK